MVEKMFTPHSPADKPDTRGGQKKPETAPQKKRGLFGKMIKGVTKEGRKVLRQERSAEQRAKESREHLREPEELRKRLKEFDAELYYFKSFDRAVATLAATLYKKARKLKLSRAGKEREDIERDLSAEARRYIFAGIIPRGDELITEDDQKKDAKHVEHLRKINDRTVARHLRTYLVWRWAEAEWKKDWNEWSKRQEEKKEMPESEISASFPKWQSELNDWTRARNMRNQQKQDIEPPRPPTPPEQSLVISMAKRLGENHMQWKIDPIKPEIIDGEKK